MYEVFVSFAGIVSFEIRLQETTHVVIQYISERLRQDVIKKVFSNNSDFRSSSDHASLAASQDTWLETAQTSNEALSHHSPRLAGPKLNYQVENTTITGQFGQYVARQRPSNSNTVPGVSRADTVVRIPTNSIPPDILGQEEDSLSIQPSRQERSDLLGDDDDSSHTLLNGSDDSDEENNARFTKYSSMTTKSDKCKEGISLDKAQCDVLKESWRAEKPMRISAFKDANRT
ncbi:hypothetical protein DPMN_074914 [Dreissena polymorpha]|uniref:Uncharacterized protein n=1 Tax=Dreissena polymorpha TaxID=45954 RepID=A0A9D3YFV4_DREPO|nr:hypothetical protein DPMN_074914 [Dreissena polymorpha]